MGDVGVVTLVAGDELVSGEGGRPQVGGVDVDHLRLLAGEPGLDGTPPRRRVPHGEDEAAVRERLVDVPVHLPDVPRPVLEGHEVGHEGEGAGVVALLEDVLEQAARAGHRLRAGDGLPAEPLEAALHAGRAGLVHPHDEDTWAGVGPGGPGDGGGASR